MRIRQVRAPLSPESYRIWFEYVLGQDKKLVSELNQLIAHKEQFTKEITDEVYDKYFFDERARKTIQKAQEEVRDMLASILGEIIASSGLVEDFGGRLEQYTDELTQCRHLSEVQAIAVRLVHDTKQMAASNRNIQKELKDATSRAVKLQGKLKKAKTESLVDSLTTLHNRRAFDREISRLYRDFKRGEGGFSIVALDIDLFKRFNDSYGHLVGDEVLRLVGALLQLNLKGKDFPARYGGEEFFILLAHTPLDKAIAVAEDILKRVSEKRFRLTKTGELVGKITVSGGVAEIREGDTIESVVERADKALYLAKDSGRDNVKSEKDR